MMKTGNAKKVVIKVGSSAQQEHVKVPRRGLKTLQPTATDKENLTGRLHTIKDPKLASENEPKKQKPVLMHKETQTEKYITNIDDLTGEEAGLDYWKRLAEKRQESLDDSFRENEKLKDKIDCLQEESRQILQENDKLKDNIDALKEENKICKDMLEESRHLVEVLQEMIGEGENEDAPEEEAESPE